MEGSAAVGNFPKKNKLFRLLGIDLSLYPIYFEL